MNDGKEENNCSSVEGDDETAPIVRHGKTRDTVDPQREMVKKGQARRTLHAVASDSGSVISAILDFS